MDSDAARSDFTTMGFNSPPLSASIQMNWSAADAEKLTPRDNSKVIITLFFMPNLCTLIAASFFLLTETTNNSELERDCPYLQLHSHLRTTQPTKAVSIPVLPVAKIILRDKSELIVCRERRQGN